MFTLWESLRWWTDFAQTVLQRRTYKACPEEGIEECLDESTAQHSQHLEVLDEWWIPGGGNVVEASNSCTRAKVKLSHDGGWILTCETDHPAPTNNGLGDLCLIRVKAKSGWLTGWTKWPEWLRAMGCDPQSIPWLTKWILNDCMLAESTLEEAPMEVCRLILGDLASVE